MKERKIEIKYPVITLSKGMVVWPMNSPEPEDESKTAKRIRAISGRAMKKSNFSSHTGLKPLLLTALVRLELQSCMRPITSTDTKGEITLLIFPGPFGLGRFWPLIKRSESVLLRAEGTGPEKLKIKY